MVGRHRCRVVRIKSHKESLHRCRHLTRRLQLPSPQVLWRSQPNFIWVNENVQLQPWLHLHHGWPVNSVNSVHRQMTAADTGPALNTNPIDGNWAEGAVILFKEGQQVDWFSTDCANHLQDKSLMQQLNSFLYFYWTGYVSAATEKCPDGFKGRLEKCGITSKHTVPFLTTVYTAVQS